MKKFAITAALIASTSALVAAYYPGSSSYDSQIQGSEVRTSYPQGYQPYYYDNSVTTPTDAPSNPPTEVTYPNSSEAYQSNNQDMYQDTNSQYQTQQTWPARRYVNQPRSQYYYAEPRTNVQYNRGGQYYDQRSGQYYMEPRTSRYNPYQSYNYDNNSNSYNSRPAYSNTYSMNDVHTDAQAAVANQGDLQSRVRRAIQTDNTLSANARNVGVSVEGDKVTLTGTVDTKQEKERVENIAKEIGGVRNVSNKLSVK